MWLFLWSPRAVSFVSSLGVTDPPPFPPVLCPHKAVSAVLKSVPRPFPTTAVTQIKVSLCIIWVLVCARHCDSCRCYLRLVLPAATTLTLFPEFTNGNWDRGNKVILFVKWQTYIPCVYMYTTHTHTHMYTQSVLCCQTGPQNCFWTCQLHSIQRLKLSQAQWICPCYHNMEAYSSSPRSPCHVWSTLMAALTLMHMIAE